MNLEVDQDAVRIVEQCASEAVAAQQVLQDADKQFTQALMRWDPLITVGVSSSLTQEAVEAIVVARDAFLKAVFDQKIAQYKYDRLCELYTSPTKSE